MSDDNQTTPHDIGERKSDHLKLCIEDQVEVPVSPGSAFDAIGLVHRALPEIDRADVDTSLTFMGKPLAFPLMVGSMTGGTAEAGRINTRLAQAAQRCGIGMFLGSQRIMLERPEVTETFSIREVAPEIPLVANIGAIQLNLGVTASDVRRIADAVGADGVVFHLNAAQEACQPEGDTAFAGLTTRLDAAVREVGLPCGVKEVGAGFSIADARSLAKMPLAFIESAGRGGTSWTLIEGRRAPKAAQQQLGELFGDWGVPSVTSLLTCVRYGGGHPVIASGGLRTGIDAAKAIAAGATLTAMALPLLRAAHESVDACVNVMLGFRDALATAMFLVGARDLATLRTVPHRIAPHVEPKAFEGHSGDPQ